MDASHRNRRKHRRTIKRNKSRNQRKMNLIIIATAIVVMAVMALVARDFYFFITGNDVTEETPYPVKGVDVSSYQLEIDWQGLEEEGYSFAFIKATEGSSLVDERFEYNWEEASSTGMKIGAYHFLSYDTSGRSQAENYIETVDKKWGMLPPVVDVEFYGDYTEVHPGKKKLRRILDTVLQELEAHYGMRPIIYTNTYIYEEYISGRYDDYDIWISAHDIPESLNDGREWTFCQYTFYGKSENVAGGEKYVDLNVFNGSSWEFRKYD